MTPRYRDANTGEYVTEEYAAQHPDTTVAETDDTDDRPEAEQEEVEETEEPDDSEPQAEDEGGPE